MISVGELVSSREPTIKGQEQSYTRLDSNSLTLVITKERL